MITLVGSLKGGSGKSTVTFNLAVWLAEAGCKVTAFDLDPQQTLVDVGQVRAEEGYSPDLDIKTLTDGDDVEQNIRSSRGSSEEILVDVGTSDMSALLSAVSVAERILIPVLPSQADVWSAQRFLKIVGKACKDRQRIPEILGFINRSDTHALVRESDEAEQVLGELPGVMLLKTRLGQRTVFRRSFSEGLGVFELEPASKATHEFNLLASTLFPKVVY